MTSARNILHYVDEIDLNEKRVVARFDFNVPLNKAAIKDTTRIDFALPTIRYILEQGAKKLVMMGHLGRPRGTQGSKRRPQFSLEPVAHYLAEQLGREVLLTESCLDKSLKVLLGLPEPRIILLQNLRFHPEEKANQHHFAKTLASYGDIYVNDAFGASHRQHASVYGINAFYKPRFAVGGLLLKKEIQALTRIYERPDPPLVVILGGSKVSDKIGVIEQFLPRCQTMIIGGAMAYPFLKARGKKIGKSLCSDEDFALAKKILSNPIAAKIVLPTDHMAADNLKGKAMQTNSADIPPDKIGLDIGPSSLALFCSHLANAKTVFWNGPMGVFERPSFAEGTLGLARALARLGDASGGTFTVVGGGDSVSALKQSNLFDSISHVSTGGGAMLEFLGQGSLPAIHALKFGLPPQEI